MATVLPNVCRYLSSLGLCQRSGNWTPRGRLDFCSGLAPVPQRGLKFFDSQFQFCCWRCLSLGRDTEAMRIAVIVGKKKVGLAVVSTFEF
jgi:hypothetical protein